MMTGWIPWIGLFLLEYDDENENFGVSNRPIERVVLTQFDVSRATDFLTRYSASTQKAHA